MMVRYLFPARMERAACFESVYPLRATFPAKRPARERVSKGWDMTFKGSEAGQSESATSPEATREPKGAAKKFRIWVIAGSSILLGVVLSVAVALAIHCCVCAG